MNIYKESGVDVEAGDDLVEMIKPIANRIQNKRVIGSIGGFAGMYELPQGYLNPVIVSCTDGVGTKLSLALELDMVDTIGQDLVAMCVNDLICTGATPMFFQDYYASSNLVVDKAFRIIKSIADACEQVGIPLLGGETAEMPRVYHDGEIDLVGFATGCVDKHKIIDGQYVHEGDVIIGFASSGFHSNGYSMINRLLSQSFKEDYAKELMAPTTLYHKLAFHLSPYAGAFAHITGGGLDANVRRVIPDHLHASISSSAWPKPDLIKLFQQETLTKHEDISQVFNMGIGFVCVCAPSFLHHVTLVADILDIPYWEIGEIVTA